MARLAYWALTRVARVLLRLTDRTLRVHRRLAERLGRTPRW